MSARRLFLYAFAFLAVLLTVPAQGLQSQLLDPSPPPSFKPSRRSPAYWQALS